MERVRCLCLLLILTSGWVQSLQARVCLISLPPNVTSLEQDVYLISAHYRQQVQEQIEVSQQESETSSTELGSTCSLTVALPTEACPRELSAGDPCSRFMSWQC
jgi:hypothetical protein